MAAAGKEFVKWQTNSAKLRATMRREVPSDCDLMDDSETKFGKPGLIELKLDDVILVEEQGRPRLQWKMGRITEVQVGKDGKVRSCELITSNGTKLRRPIQRLVHLEFRVTVARESVKTSVLHVALVYG
uniref:DUF5641 domain-containing protein n=1 Tax=Strigamia maritima TaxID=126957 RepID=T1IT06_STRMM